MHSTQMWIGLADAFDVASSRAEALNFAAGLPGSLSILISLWPQNARPADQLYSMVWPYHGSVSRAFAERQRPSDSGTDERTAKLFGLKREISRLALARLGIDASQAEARRTRLKELVAQKESLERELGDAAATGGRSIRAESHVRLLECMPHDAVFVDVCRYTYCERIPVKSGNRKSRATQSYVAFVLSHDDPVQMVELGPAEPIDAAIHEWREAITDDRASQSPDELRRLAWKPIEMSLPADTATVYLAPDGALTSIPWHALPGKEGGSVLLEEYAFAFVPYGPFLLGQIKSRKPDRSAEGVLLAVGDVSYDEQPPAPTDAAVLAAIRSEAAIDRPGVRWNDLPGTREEIEGIFEIAGDRKTVSLMRSHANTARVFAELPNARWAILATHGFFADAKLRSAMGLDESIFTRIGMPFTAERTTPVGRNPLLLSGLVLAGANAPRSEDDLGIPHGDGGILTAEAIASLPLDKLELAVLSACDTGLGEVAGGEGVFGLQRAFHQAGAANVVASLWKIDDRATAALMRLFYFKFFRENKPPLAALREAQLAIYHHPEQIGALASARAPEFGKAVRLVEGGKPASSNGRAATRLWAGFVLSGAGN